ncbi:MAG TPA: choice-of-anchor D domain-containing protein [Terriglobales bacterium]|nr:choice-of-anchor D domain-containing protein [Terriglobales bacterium]
MKRPYLLWRTGWTCLTLLGILISPLLLSAGINPNRSVNFGNVAVGGSSTLAIALTNKGKATLTISQITVSGPGFSFTPIALPLTLDPGQSTNLSSTFAPLNTGYVVGSIVLTNSMSHGNQSNSISLYGTGTSAGTLVANPSSLTFSNVTVGTTQSLTETITNSGSSSISISSAAPSGSGFSISGLNVPLTLAAGQSQSFTVSFSPQWTGNFTGTVAITSTAVNSPLNILLSGTAVAAGTLVANPASLNFGSVQVGSSLSLSETLTNTGGSSVTVSQVSATGPGFSVSGLTLPMTLAAGKSFTFNATFAPTAAGNDSGSISVTSTASNPNLSISLSGTATSPGQLTVSPASMNFGNVVVGGSQTQTGTITASGASVTLTSDSSSNSVFTLSGISLPLTLGIGQSASFSVTFTPQTAGAASGTISFVSNATNSPANESVSGTGTTPPQHSVALSWKASTSVVIGYNVYRGLTSGGPYTMINSLDPTTAYTDSGVQAGQTYYYVTTAVDSGGNESTYSNQVSAAIPTP